MRRTIYTSSEGEAGILDLYDSFQKSVGMAFNDRMVNTRFGETHVLVTGPEQGLPVGPYARSRQLTKSPLM